MAYSLEHAYYVQHELSRLIIKSGTNPANKCFFTDGAFVANSQLERTANTWNHDDFVVICEKEILAYFEATLGKQHPKRKLSLKTTQPIFNDNIKLKLFL